MRGRVSQTRITVDARDCRTIVLRQYDHTGIGGDGYHIAVWRNAEVHNQVRHIEPRQLVLGRALQEDLQMLGEYLVHQVVRRIFQIIETRSGGSW